MTNDTLQFLHGLLRAQTINCAAPDWQDAARRIAVALQEVEAALTEREAHDDI